MSLLDQPEAQALLNDADVTPKTVKGFAGRLIEFLQRYLPKFYRVEQRANATLVIRGLISGLERKTCEPIAIQAGLPRKPIQFFVGAGKWDDEAVMTELRGPCPRGTGKLGWRGGYPPQRLPQERDGILWRRPSMVRPAGKTGQLPGRCVLGLCRLVGLWPVGPPALPAQGLGDRQRTPIEMPCAPGNSGSRRSGGSRWICWTGACLACPMAGLQAMTNSVDRRSSATSCAAARNAMYSTSHATP